MGKKNPAIAGLKKFTDHKKAVTKTKYSPASVPEPVHNVEKGGIRPWSQKPLTSSMTSHQYGYNDISKSS